MLETIPPEVLSHIALHLVIATKTPPTDLLCVSKTIHAILSPSANPRLYARVFRHHFDVAAAERRLGDLTARELTVELRRRVTSLDRLKRLVSERNVGTVSEGDLWVVFLMLIENGESLRRGKGADVRWEKHSPSARDRHPAVLCAVPRTEPAGRGHRGRVSERDGPAGAGNVDRRSRADEEAVAGKQHETAEERDERLFVLRPYVFAAQQYELYFAPWTLPDLPLVLTTPRIETADEVDNPFLADLAPRSRLVSLQVYGRQIAMAPPMLSHAAILSFFIKTAHVSETSPAVALLPPTGGPPTTPPADVDEDDNELTKTHKMDITDSRFHDRDFERMRACYDPSLCRGMKPAAWRKSWDGYWEGNFSFFDYDAFREMLAGHMSALYEGPFGEQAQVWKLKETYVRKKKPKAATTPLLTPDSETDVPSLVPQPEPKGLPLTGPSTNAGFPTDQLPAPSAGMPSAAAEAATMRETIRQQVDSIEGYEIVPEDELDDELNERDGGEKAGLEMLLTGTGHSAWGRFILKGRVRTWDGMASLVKEYAPVSRGKWIYRGYVLSNDIFVGRWRDTFTPEAYVGYEGTFILNRR
ncbi:hypothetical protein P7C73_g4567, partial [Tremellales sp. Uapishka_1]